MAGFLNIDYRDLPTVDIVHNLCVFPWPLPDECASIVMASHLVEHINPTCFDPRLGLLIDLLIRKNLLNFRNQLTAGMADETWARGVAWQRGQLRTAARLWLAWALHPS